MHCPRGQRWYVRLPYRRLVAQGRRWDAPVRRGVVTDIGADGCRGRMPYRSAYDELHHEYWQFNERQSRPVSGSPRAAPQGRWVEAREPGSLGRCKKEQTHLPQFGVAPRQPRMHHKGRGVLVRPGCSHQVAHYPRPRCWWNSAFAPALGGAAGLCQRNGMASRRRSRDRPSQICRLSSWADRTHPRCPRIRGGTRALRQQCPARRRRARSCVGDSDHQLRALRGLWDRRSAIVDGYWSRYWANGPISHRKTRRARRRCRSWTGPWTWGVRRYRRCRRLAGDRGRNQGNPRRPLGPASPAREHWAVLWPVSPIEVVEPGLAHGISLGTCWQLVGCLEALICCLS